MRQSRPGRRKQLIAGIDIGTITIAVVLLNSKGTVVFKDYRFHNGNIYAVMEGIIRKLPVKKLITIGVVAEKGREFFSKGIEVNEQVAIIEGVKNYIPDIGSIINIGGENFGLILFNQQGQYEKYISNSACAAGTGSFLDQQAARLGLSGSAELSRLALSYQGVPPQIATRCAVFAKTDLVHMQQQGYKLSAITAGLCRGVAQNICNTLFHGIKLLEPIAVVGGVSKNKRVVEYIAEESRYPLQTLPYGEYIGAIGAAFTAWQQSTVIKKIIPVAVNKLLVRTSFKKKYYYSPLNKNNHQVVDFTGWQSYEEQEVEVDIYEKLIKNTVIHCYLGIDIGSTSTKAAIMSRQSTVMVGLYTRTSGQPITALQRITRVLENLEKRFMVEFSFISTGTTGAGRKFIQKITQAEYVVDEITAHASAAYHLNPEIDTIIEIGGQDAKFTVMHNGNVTFSVMNYVCAAGTGSFIEEQARQLGIPINEYAVRAQGKPAPLISDRCTVFMQRDLNHLLSLGYSIEELLAAALHSVRDNYLLKVAHLNKIGRYIAFQGATAKNYALVQAFEQKLKKPIYVSKYCHLTGAIGVCLKMAEMKLSEKSRFRKDLHKESIVADEYVCDYCNNHCKIKTITIDNKSLGWGYLCGRDEKDVKYRKKAKSGFDLLSKHRKVFEISKDIRQLKMPEDVNVFREFKRGGIRTVMRQAGFSLARIRNRIQFNLLELRRDIFSTGILPQPKSKNHVSSLKIGLPATLTMLEYLPMWELFFQRLGFTTIISSMQQNHITAGIEIKGADFCTPITDYLGHIKQLSSRVDYIFCPQFYENSTEKEEKSYCYYSNYAVPIVQNIPELNLGQKMITPVINLNKNINQTIGKLYIALSSVLKKKVTFTRVEAAFFLAWDWFLQRKADLKDMFLDQIGTVNDISVVLIGRPYLILHPALNKGIPEKLSAMGIQSFYMDMIPVDEKKLDVALDFIHWNHWYYGDQIIKTTETIARTKGLFPIYLTAFRCAPDSFIIEYFKEIMDYYRKPYLILQLDEHEAAEGYDTRLEAAVETFRNFKGSNKRSHKPIMKFKNSFKDKIYLLPGYDLLSARLIQSVFTNAGIKSLIIEQTPEIINRSLQINNGQCLPVSILTQGIEYTISKNSLNPEKVAFFSNTQTELSCNLPQYPVMIKQVLEKMGQSLGKVDILVTKFIPLDLPLDVVYGIAMAYMLAGLMQKIVHKIRPLEMIPGEIDECCRLALDKLIECFLKGRSKEEAFKAVVDDFLKIDLKSDSLPKVGIVGDLYVRDNDTFNQNLVGHIEKSGAEVVTVPFIDTLNLVVEMHFKNQWQDGRYINLLKDKVAFNIIQVFNRKFKLIIKPIIPHSFNGLRHDPAYYLKKHFLTIKHIGETSENLLKVYYLKENYPDLRLIINVNPIFCCPGLISEAIYKKVEKEIGIPIISITYDGTKTDKNKVLNPYLYFLK